MCHGAEEFITLHVDSKKFSNFCFCAQLNYHVLEGKNPSSRAIYQLGKHFAHHQDSKMVHILPQKRKKKMVHINMD